MLRFFRRKFDNSAYAEAYKEKLILTLDQYRSILVTKYGLNEATRHVDLIIYYIDFQHAFHRKNVLDQRMVSKISTEFINQLVSENKSTDDIFAHGNTISEFFEFIMSNQKVQGDS